MTIWNDPIRKTLGALLLVGALMAPLGCAKKDEQSDAPAPSRSDQGPTETFTIKGEDGKEVTIQFSEEGEGRAVLKTKGDDGEEVFFETGLDSLPAGFPKDFPVCDNTKVTGQVMNIEDATVFTVSLNADDDIEKVAAFYQKNLPEKGYEVKATMAMGGATHIVFEKGDNVAGSVTITKEDDQTVVAISLQTKK